MYRQDAETFLRVLENAFRHFGGVPRVLNVDNLKAAVVRADWYDPDIHPKLAEFCRHYGVCVVPCRAGKPQHKGKVERGVAYVRNNALKGHRFASLEAENAHLTHWESHVADTRIHGTTCKQVAALFAEEIRGQAAYSCILTGCHNFEDNLRLSSLLQWRTKLALTYKFIPNLSSNFGTLSCASRSFGEICAPFRHGPLIIGASLLDGESARICCLTPNLTPNSYGASFALWLRCSLVGYYSIAAALAPCQSTQSITSLCRLSREPLGTLFLSITARDFSCEVENKFSQVLNFALCAGKCDRTPQ